MEIVRVEVAPVLVGVRVAGESDRVPQGLLPDVTAQADGVGEMVAIRVTGDAAPLVSLAVIVTLVLEPETTVPVDELIERE